MQGNKIEDTMIAQEHLERGRLFFKDNKYESAIKEFNQAIDKGYTGRDIHKDLGLTYLNQGDYDSAIRELKRAFLLGLNDIDIHIELGRAYRERGDYKKSIEELNQAYKVMPGEHKLFFHNKILNEIEISEGKIVLDSKPIELWVTLTSKCNLRCVMCEVWKSNWELSGKTVGQIIKLLPYLKEIYWQGGEVFFSEYFQELFEAASSYPYLKQNINTNGLLIDEKWAEKLARSNISITFAIDGVTKDTYESIRRGARFENLINNINAINRYKRKYNGGLNSANRMVTNMRFIIMRSNYYEIEQTVEFAKRYEFDYLQICPIEGMVSLENIFLHNDQEAIDHIKKCIPKIVNKARRCGCNLDIQSFLKTYFQSKTHYESSEETTEEKEHNSSSGQRCPAMKSKARICEFPWQGLFICRQGAVMPSCLCIKEVGNTHKNSLEEIWNSETMQLYRKSILINDYQRLCNRIPKDSEARFEQIKIHYSDNKYPSVINELEEFIKHNPDNVEAHMLLARAYVARRKLDLAIGEFKKVLIKSPQNREVHYELGMLYAQNKALDLALRELKQALQFAPRNSDIHLELSRLYQEKGEHTKAMEELEGTLKHNASNVRIHFEMGRVYQQKKDYDLSIKELKQALKLGLDTPELHFELGRTYRKKKDFDSSLKELKQAIEFGLNNEEVHLELGKAYREINDYDSSLKELNKALQLGLDNVELHIELSRLYQGKGEYAKAMQELEETLKHNPSDGRIYLELARIYRKNNDHASAIKELKQAIEFGLDNEEVHLELNKTYREIVEKEIGLITN